MKRIMIYDLPTRFFHWIFAALFVIAFAIAKTVDDESLIFSFHMLAGLLLTFSVLLRIVWGVVGSEHARFSNFSLKPQQLFKYFQGVIGGDLTKWAGHNPASSWATLLMFFIALALGLTGYLMASGPENDFIKDIHELLANAFIVVVIAHVAGVLLHIVRHRDGLGLSMLNGQKTGVPEKSGISSQRPIVATLFIALIAVFGLNLYKNFDSKNRTLNFFGSQLTLGENENESGDQGEEDEEDEGDDDGDDD